ncbi:hypothetical protein CFHF_03635 [Caulobacter flavus]|uniref:Uncharacterized protein n=1 Tax=Caulobacter flavus TaxID=1679497 RepID=A0A2N5CZ93_9CAUL|nr:hypothetical protein [Caulobacter flavus]AYV45208.1 hypothetical protein C1707_02535 [Caulobacter flavus]PLR19112.1 hypothetical protein CFHF_03635 [Caulobacter flavus]
MRPEYLLLVPCLAACGVGILARRVSWAARWAALSAGLLGPLFVVGAPVGLVHVAAGVGGAGLFLGVLRISGGLIAHAERVSQTPRVR